MITRIARSYWVAARLALLGLGAAFVATAVSSVVGARLGRTRGESSARSVEPRQQAARGPLSEYLPVARRNLFAAPSEGGATPVETARESGPAGIQLLGTGGPAHAPYAVIEDTRVRKQRLLEIGDSLDGAEVVEIGWRRVILRRDSGEELLTVPAHLGTSRGGAPPPRAPSPGATAAAAGDGQVRALGDDRYMLSRAEVDHQLSNLSTLFTQMRAVPNIKDGRTEGFRLFAIRGGSLFQQLGLQNNDVVQRINGVELSDPTRAMGLFEEFKGEKRLSVDVLRGGETRTLSYEIR